jgi:dihydrofolate reductase
MRNLIFAINLSLDGCCDHTAFNPGQEILEYFTQLTREADVQIFGRKTYELMVPYWPQVAEDHSGTKADIEFARAFVAIDKLVFSRTLNSVADNKTRIARSNLQDEVLQLKQAPGQSLLVGGVDIASQLIGLGLVDEFRFVIAPVIAGKGRRFLEEVDLPAKLQLTLVDSKVFKSGCVALRYLKQ